MLKLPGNLDAEQFLARYWQKKPLLLPQAVDNLRPAVTRNELAWLATLDDVESRIVFTERGGERVRYRAETGPFDDDYLVALPARDWTLLVHDVEKHLPALRRLFDMVPFIPDWRIDDLMVSFAAPGGGVGPHRDNYDVFLCQGVGIREWHVTSDSVADDPLASDDLALTAEFSGELSHECRNGDVLYLPPGVVHWGIARRACLTYSIGMRAPQMSDLAEALPDAECSNPFYSDSDLRLEEVRPGYISSEAIDRARHSGDRNFRHFDHPAQALGRFATETKQWITPDVPDEDELAWILDELVAGRKRPVHGMTRLAWTDRFAFVNGACEPLRGDEFRARTMELLCRDRSLQLRGPLSKDEASWITWLARQGTFEIPDMR